MLRPEFRRSEIGGEIVGIWVEVRPKLECEPVYVALPRQNRSFGFTITCASSGRLFRKPRTLDLSVLSSKRTLVTDGGKSGGRVTGRKADYSFLGPYRHGGVCLTLSAFVQHKVLAKRLVAVAEKSINVRSFFWIGRLQSGRFRRECRSAAIDISDRRDGCANTVKFCNSRHPRLLALMTLSHNDQTEL